METLQFRMVRMKIETFIQTYSVSVAIQFTIYRVCSNL